MPEADGATHAHAGFGRPKTEKARDPSQAFNEHIDT
jgi:hypothetical protein